MTTLIERNITNINYPPLAATPASTTQGFLAHSPTLPAPESASLIDNILNAFVNTAEASGSSDLLA